MILYTLIAVILWFVAPLLVEGHIKKRTDRKAMRLLCRIVAILFFALALYKAFLL